MITDWRRKVIFSLIVQPLIGQLYSRSSPTPRQHIWNLMSFKNEEREKKNRKRKIKSKRKRKKKKKKKKKKGRKKKSKHKSIKD